MNLKRCLLTTALSLAAVAVAFAADPNVGTWKLNEAKSKFAPGAVENLTVVYTAVGDNYKCVVDGVDGAGKPSHNEWTGKFDGKDYPVVGDPSADARSLMMVKAGQLCADEQQGRQGGPHRHRRFLRRRQDRTLTTETTDAAGKKTTSITVDERQ